MNVDYKAIADAVQVGETYEEAFTRLSSLTETVDKDIQTADIKAYLTLVGKRLAIEEGTHDSAKIARLSFSDFESYRLTENPAYKVQLTSVLDNLITDGYIDAADKTAILDLGSEDKPMWPNLKAGHVQMAIRYRELGEV